MRTDSLLGLLDVGDLPYNVLRPILLKIDDAKQLVRTPAYLSQQIMSLLTLYHSDLSK